MEIGVAVDGCLSLVIHHVLARPGLLLIKLICETRIQNKINFMEKLLLWGQFAIRFPYFAKLPFLKNIFYHQTSILEI